MEFSYYRNLEFSYYRMEIFNFHTIEFWNFHTIENWIKNQPNTSNLTYFYNINKTTFKHKFLIILNK